MTDDQHNELPPEGRRNTPWYRNPAVLIPLVAAVIGAIVGGFQIYDRCCSKTTAFVSVQYVVDTSHAMAHRIKGTSKLQVVKSVLLGDVENDTEVAHGLTLAPACGPGAKPQQIDPNTGNLDAFKNALNGVSPRGHADLATSIRSAVGELIKQEQSGGQRSVLVLLVGGRDTCGGGAAALADELDLLKKESVKLRFRFIGLKAPKTVRDYLTRLEKRAHHAGFQATVKFATSRATLEAATEALPSPTPTATSG